MEDNFAGDKKLDDDMSCSAVLIHFGDLHSLLMYLVKINPTLTHKIAKKNQTNALMDLKVKL